MSAVASQNYARKQGPRLVQNRRFGLVALTANSPSDKCKISPFCVFDDKNMKLSTKLEGIIRNIFSYRAIADLSRDPNGSHFKMTS